MMIKGAPLCYSIGGRRSSPDEPSLSLVTVGGETGTSVVKVVSEVEVVLETVSPSPEVNVVTMEESGCSTTGGVGDTGIHIF